MLQKLKCYLSHIVIIKVIKNNKLNMLQSLKLTKRKTWVFLDELGKKQENSILHYDGNNVSRVCLFIKQLF